MVTLCSARLPHLYRNEAGHGSLVCPLSPQPAAGKGGVPGAVGVPEMIPVAGASASPAGKVPETTLQVYGVDPAGRPPSV